MLVEPFLETQGQKTSQESVTWLIVCEEFCDPLWSESRLETGTLTRRKSAVNIEQILGSFPTGKP